MNISPKRQCSTLYTTFETEHERLYGHRSDPDNPIEVVAVRLIGQAGIRGQQGVLNPAERLGSRALSREAYFRGTVGKQLIPLSSHVTIWERKAQLVPCSLTNTIQPLSFHLTIVGIWIVKETFL